MRSPVLLTRLDADRAMNLSWMTTTRRQRLRDLIAILAATTRAGPQTGGKLLTRRPPAPDTVLPPSMPCSTASKPQELARSNLHRPLCLHPLEEHARAAFEAMRSPICHGIRADLLARHSTRAPFNSERVRSRRRCDAQKPRRRICPAPAGDAPDPGARHPYLRPRKNVVVHTPGRGLARFAQYARNRIPEASCACPQTAGRVQRAKDSGAIRRSRPVRCATATNRVAALPCRRASADAGGQCRGPLGARGSATRRIVCGSDTQSCAVVVADRTCGTALRAAHPASTWISCLGHARRRGARSSLATIGGNVCSSELRSHARRRGRLRGSRSGRAYGLDPPFGGGVAVAGDPSMPRPTHFPAWPRCRRCASRNVVVAPQAQLARFPRSGIARSARQRNTLSLLDGGYDATCWPARDCRLGFDHASAISLARNVARARRCDRDDAAAGLDDAALCRRGLMRPRGAASTPIGDEPSLHAAARCRSPPSAHSKATCCSERIDRRRLTVHCSRAEARGTIGRAGDTVPRTPARCRAGACAHQ